MMKTLTPHNNDDESKLLICPYDKSHVIQLSKFQIHLTKCRKNYTNASLMYCPFNEVHVVKEAELQYHIQTCPDRKELDKYVHKIGEAYCAAAALVPVQRPANNIPSDSEENWDNCENTVSVIDALKQKAAEKPLLRSLPGKTKSERKQFRQEERLRHSKLMESGSASAASTSTETVPERSTTELKPARVQPELQMLDSCDVDPTFSMMPGRGRGKPKSTDEVSKPGTQIQSVQLDVPESYRFPVPEETHDDDSHDQQGNLVRPNHDGGFCQLPIPGRGRGKRRST